MQPVIICFVNTRWGGRTLTDGVCALLQSIKNHKKESRLHTKECILQLDDFAPSSGNRCSVLTVSLLFPAEPEPDGFVSEAATEVLCGPLEGRPVSGHAGEDGRLLQVMQDLLDLIWTERFAA